MYYIYHFLDVSNLGVTKFNVIVNMTSTQYRFRSFGLSKIVFELSIIMFGSNFY